ncbi:hypothetical protein NMY22_g3768 [Coprinellus aureogranulatus]|nr:hypothetical protein NMY22_g3768 [Coprinellus aureogranulatus]
MSAYWKKLRAKSRRPGTRRDERRLAHPTAFHKQSSESSIHPRKWRKSARKVEENETDVRNGDDLNGYTGSEHVSTCLLASITIVRQFVGAARSWAARRPKPSRIRYATTLSLLHPELYLVAHLDVLIHTPSSSSLPSPEIGHAATTPEPKENQGTKVHDTTNERSSFITRTAQGMSVLCQLYRDPVAFPGIAHGSGPKPGTDTLLCAHTLLPQVRKNWTLPPIPPSPRTNVQGFAVQPPEPGHYRGDPSGFASPSPAFRTKPKQELKEEVMPVLPNKIAVSATWLIPLPNAFDLFLESQLEWTFHPFSLPFAHFFRERMKELEYDTKHPLLHGSCCIILEDLLSRLGIEPRLQSGYATLLHLLTSGIAKWKSGRDHVPIGEPEVQPALHEHISWNTRKPLSLSLARTMKFNSVAVALLAGLAIPVSAILYVAPHLQFYLLSEELLIEKGLNRTKGTIEIKKPGSTEKGAVVSTFFDDYDGDIIASDGVAPPALQVQIDLEKAEKEDSDIEVLNGFWAPDLYRYFGLSSRESYWPSLMSFMNVQQTPSALPQRKENAFTACYPNPMSELPLQASAIWRYNPETRILTPKVLALNGTQLPRVLTGGWYEGNCEFLTLYFNPATPSNATGEALVSRVPISIFCYFAWRNANPSCFACRSFTSSPMRSDSRLDTAGVRCYASVGGVNQEMVERVMSLTALRMNLVFPTSLTSDGGSLLKVPLSRLCSLSH